MTGNHDGMMLLRADLCERLDRLQLAARSLSTRDLSRGLMAIRTQAAAYGLVPVVALADAFERALRSQARMCPAQLYLDRMRDAIGCAPDDSDAGAALAASVSVRLVA